MSSFTRMYTLGLLFPATAFFRLLLVLILQTKEWMLSIFLLFSPPCQRAEDRECTLRPLSTRRLRPLNWFRTTGLESSKSAKPASCRACLSTPSSVPVRSVLRVFLEERVQDFLESFFPTTCVAILPCNDQGWALLLLVDSSYNPVRSPGAQV